MMNKRIPIIFFLLIFILSISLCACKQATENIHAPRIAESVEGSTKADKEHPVTEVKSGGEKEPVTESPPDKPSITVPSEGLKPPSPAIDFKDKPVEPIVIETDATDKVKMSISCATLLDNMDLLKPAKRELVPEDGWILAEKEIELIEGESAFELLQRVTRANKIHMEFMFTPMYDSAYIEGIHNLYEFDAGDLSGWMYKVNGEILSVGSSKYILKPGDIIEWVYTCDLGGDVGARVP